MVKKSAEGRGKLLTVLIIIQILSFLVALPFIGNDVIHPLDRQSFSFLMGIFSVICVYFIFKLKKIGAYCLMVAIGINVLESLIDLPYITSRYNLTNLDDGLVRMIWPTLSLVLFYWILWFYAIKRKWHLFT